MSAFDIMLAAVFGDASMASDAVYQAAAPSSPTVAMRAAMVDVADAEISPFTAKVTQPRLAAEVRISELAQPREGDAITIAGQPYTIASFERDRLRLVWRLALREA